MPATLFSSKVAACRRDLSRNPDPAASYRPENDSGGTQAHAFVSGVYDALRKEAGLSEGAAYGFLCGLAELGGAPAELTSLTKHATFWGGVAALPGNALNAALLPERTIGHAISGFVHPGGDNPSLMDRFGGMQRGGAAPIAYDTGKALPNLGQDGAPPLPPGQNFAAYANVAGNVVRRPRAAMEGLAAASSSDNMANLTHKAVNGDWMGAAGDAWDGVVKDKVAPWLHDHAGGFGDMIGQNLDTAHLKAMAPHVIAGLGTFAASKLMGMGTGTSLAAGLAGGYGLPKLYDQFAAHAAAAAAPAAPTAAPAAAQVAGVINKTPAQARMDQSQQSANDLAARARQ